MDKDPPNLDLLIKLLKMTTSSNEGEVLVAIRKANEQLRKFGGDWERLLKGKVTVIGDPFANVAPPPPARQAPRPSPHRPPPSWTQPAASQPARPAQTGATFRQRPAPQPTAKRKAGWRTTRTVASSLDDLI